MMNYLKVIVAVAATVLCTSMSVHASEPLVATHQVAGEVTWIDLKLGLLQLERDANPRTGDITEYRITEQETRVTNPSDSKFLSVADLQPGQHVVIDVVNGQEDKIVQKITVEPRPASELQEAYGEIESIDVPAGTLVIVGRPRINEAGERNLSSFVFDTQNLVVMQSPSSQPVQLVLKPGDVVKVEYVVSDGKKWARSITLYSAKVVSTTTTTTVTTTQ